jgi:ABC-type multidrug transport system ATPase subunit
MTKTIISANGVHFNYRTRAQCAVLSGASLRVEESKVTALVGKNGSGKSTLLRILLGHAVPQAGSVQVRSEKLHGPLGRYLKLGVVSQTNSLDVKLNVAQNLDLAAALYGVRGAAQKQRAQELLSQFGMESYAQTKVADLSGGQKRRIDIVRALMSDPELLVMDEPGAGLDRSSVSRLWQDLRAYLAIPSSSLQAILFVSHQSQELEFADSFVVMQDGRTSEQMGRKEIDAMTRLDRLILGLAPSQADGEIRQKLVVFLQGLGCSVVAADSSTFDASKVEIAAANGHFLIPRIFESELAASITSVELRQEDVLDRVLRFAALGAANAQQAAGGGA